MNIKRAVNHWQYKNLKNKINLNIFQNNLGKKLIFIIKIFRLKYKANRVIM